MSSLEEAPAHDEAQAHHEAPKTLKRWAVLAGLLLLIAGAYVFFVSAGRIVNWPIQTWFLNDQAEGFRQGHLHLAEEPSPELLRQTNPFDGVHRPLWYWDASLYKGHYYLYWGPVPALLLTAFKVLFRVSGPIEDQYPVFVLSLLQAVIGALLSERIARRLFKDVPLAWVATAVLVFAFAGPATYNLARPAVYESAIIGGHAFALLGLLFAFDAVWRAQTGATPKRWQLGAAGCAWGLSLGCRVSLAPAFPVLLLLAAWFATPVGDGRWRRRIVSAFWVGAPVAIALLALLAYNRLRFDRWLEFGRVYQMTWIPISMSPAFVAPNLYSYAFRPLLFGCKFPYLYVAQNMPRAFPRWFLLPRGYDNGEPVAGILVTIPWSWTAIVAGAVGARSFWRRWRGRNRAAGATTAGWFVASTLLLGALGTLALFSLFTASQRYLGDVGGCFALMGTMGAWWLRGRWHERRWARRTIDVVCAGLAIATIAIGVALGFQGQYGFFRLYNPTLMDKLERTLSVCATPAAINDHKR